MKARNRTPFLWEWPTLALLALVYTLWGGITHFADQMPWWATLALLSPVITLHSSLQHEVLHIIEPKSKGFGQALVFPAIGLFVPYLRFRDTHVAHHDNEILTDPYDDPETCYLTREVWSDLTGPTQYLLMFNNTLLGRILIGPVIGQIAFVTSEWREAKKGNKSVLNGWLVHLFSVSMILIWLHFFASIPLWLYAIAAYFGLSLLKIRTFLEHRAFAAANGRSVIIEDKGPLAILFLNNNLHAVHHAHPNVPWYNLPAVYQQRKLTFLERNRNYRFKNYAEVFSLFFFKPKEPVSHPLWSLENRSDR